MVSIFSDSSFARKDQGYSKESISLIRMAEDRSFCRSVGAELTSLGFLDAPERLGISPSSVFDQRRRRWLNDLQPLKDAISGLVQRYEDPVLVLPLGIGGHVDHIASRMAGSQVAKELGLECLFYVEQPYFCQTGGQLHESYRNSISCRVDVKSDISLLRQKYAHIRCYPSQPASIRAEDALNEPSLRYEEILLSICTATKEFMSCQLNT